MELLDLSDRLGRWTVEAGAESEWLPFSPSVTQSVSSVSECSHLSGLDHFGAKPKTTHQQNDFLGGNPLTSAGDLKQSRKCFGSPKHGLEASQGTADATEGGLLLRLGWLSDVLLTFCLSFGRTFSGLELERCRLPRNRLTQSLRGFGFKIGDPSKLWVLLLVSRTKQPSRVPSKKTNKFASFGVLW